MLCHHRRYTNFRGAPLTFAHETSDSYFAIFQGTRQRVSSERSDKAIHGMFTVTTGVLSLISAFSQSSSRLSPTRRIPAKAAKHVGRDITRRAPAAFISSVVAHHVYSVGTPIIQFIARTALFEIVPNRPNEPN